MVVHHSSTGSLFLGSQLVMCHSFQKIPTCTTIKPRNKIKLLESHNLKMQQKTQCKHKWKRKCIFCSNLVFKNLHDPHNFYQPKDQLHQ